MGSNDWRRIEELYHAALEQPQESRSEFLAAVCQGDSDLLREVNELLAHDGNTGALIDRPAWERANTVLNTMELKIGTQLGPYRIDGVLGSGGMGTVYRATDTRLGRTVAVKILRTNSEPAAMQLRFKREAQAISSLNHPRICSLFDIGTFGETSYLVMECVQGETLAEILRDGPLLIERVVQVGWEIAQGLAAAHAKGIIHRDLKPSNVMVTDTGAKILDFGLSKTIFDSNPGGASTATIEGVVMGTPAYMSPEHFAGANVDARSDIFAFGLVLYEMVTGERASGNVHAEASRLIRNKLAGAPSGLRQIPPALERIIAKCLQSEPENRYPTAGELERDLKQIDSASLRGTGAYRWRRIAAAVAFVLIGALLLWRFIPRRESGKIDSLAVLPLDNLSGDAGQNYFADGMTEVLITDLGRIGSLRVISRPSVMRFRGQRGSLRDIAAELNVDALVVGSVARAEGKVRVTAQLYDAAKDRQLWAESYERDMRDVIALQREIAQSVTNGIKAKVTPQETARLSKSHQVNPEAYDAYLRGVLLYGRHSNSDNQAAIAIMERAMSLDPGFAAGHALLGLAYVERLFTFAPQDQKPLEEKAYVSIEKAITLDPDEAMAYFARGRMLWTPGNHFPHEKAIREYRHALVLNPNLAEARAQLALTYNHVGLLEKGLREARAAASINPVDALPRIVIGQALLYGAQFDRALSIWTTNPPDAYASVTGSHTAWTLFQMGRRDEAAAKVEEFLAKHPADVGGLGVRAVLLAASGRKNEAERVIRSIEGQKGFGHFHHTAYYIACAYAHLGNITAALEWVREAAESGFPCLPLLERDGNLAPLHRDSRWTLLMSEIKQEWERYDKLSSETTSASL